MKVCLFGSNVHNGWGIYHAITMSCKVELKVVFELPSFTVHSFSQVKEGRKLIANGKGFEQISLHCTML